MRLDFTYGVPAGSVKVPIFPRLGYRTVFSHRVRSTWEKVDLLRTTGIP